MRALKTGFGRVLNRAFGRTLRGASLLEAIVAALVFLVVFAVAMDLLPRLAVREDDSALLAEAEYRTARTVESYSTGLWPVGEYEEKYDWGRITVRIAPCDAFADMQELRVETRIDGTRRRMELRRLIECAE